MTNKQADTEHIKQKIKDKLNEAYSDILDHHNIESGDITPLQQADIEKSEAEVVESTVQWIQSRCNEVEEK